MTNDRNLDELIDYAQHALGEGYPYEVTERDLALTLQALRAFKASQSEPSEDLGGCSIMCSGCGRETVLRYTDRTKTHVSIASVTGWTYTPAGVRCNSCSAENRTGDA